MTHAAALPQAFEEAFDELFPRAYRLAYRLLGQIESAEDVAAEALARAFARWPRVSQLDYRDAWVLRVTANLAVDVLRRRARGDLPVMTRQEDEDVDLRLALGVALRSLPRRQRQAVSLRYLADLPSTEVARVLHISPGSVKLHVHRGVTALRTRLGNRFLEVLPVVDSASA